MITSWQMYWLTRLDSLIGASLPFMILGVLFSVAWVVVKAINIQEQDGAVDKFLSFSKWFVFPILLIGLIGQTLIPSTKDMAAILVAPKILNNSEVQKLPDNILKLANEWMEELRPKQVEK